MENLKYILEILQECLLLWHLKGLFNESNLQQHYFLGFSYVGTIPSNLILIVVIQEPKTF